MCSSDLPRAGVLGVAYSGVGRPQAPLHARGPLLGPVRRCVRGALRRSDREPAGAVTRLTGARDFVRIHFSERGNSSVGRASACHAEGRRFESGFPLWCGEHDSPFLWPRSQVVRRRSAKPLFGGSNPPGASRVVGAAAGPRRGTVLRARRGGCVRHTGVKNGRPPDRVAVLVFGDLDRPHAGPGRATHRKHSTAAPPS